MLASATTFLDTRSICVLFALPANTSSFNLSAFSAASSTSAVVLSIRVVVSSAIFQSRCVILMSIASDSIKILPGLVSC